MARNVVFCLLFGLLSLFCSAGCSSSQDPMSQVEGMLNSYETGDMEQMRTYTIAGQEASIDGEVQQYLDANKTGIVAYGSEFFDGSGIIPAIAKRSSFTVGKVNRGNDRAVVTVTAETPDMVAIITGLLGTPDLPTMSDTEIIMQLKEAIESADTMNSEFEIVVEKMGDTWLVDSSPFSFRDRLTGGLYSGYQKLYLQVLQDLRDTVGE